MTKVIIWPGDSSLTTQRIKAGLEEVNDCYIMVRNKQELKSVIKDSPHNKHYIIIHHGQLDDYRSFMDDQTDEESDLNSVIIIHPAPDWISAGMIQSQRNQMGVIGYVSIDDVHSDKYRMASHLSDIIKGLISSDVDNYDAFKGLQNCLRAQVLNKALNPDTSNHPPRLK